MRKLGISCRCWKEEEKGSGARRSGVTPHLPLTSHAHTFCLTFGSRRVGDGMCIDTIELCTPHFDSKRLRQSFVGLACAAFDPRLPPLLLAVMAVNDMLRRNLVLEKTPQSSGESSAAWRASNTEDQYPGIDCVMEGCVGLSELGCSRREPGKPWR